MKKIVVIAVILALAGPVSAEWLGSKSIRAAEDTHRMMRNLAQAQRNVCQAARHLAQLGAYAERLANPALWCGMAGRFEAEVNRMAAEVRRLQAMEAGAKRWEKYRQIGPR